VQVTAVASPRHHQDPTAVVIWRGGSIALSEGKNFGQGADQDDLGLVALFSLVHLDAIDHGAYQLHGLRAG
jgi:hypothetical protein